MTPIDLFDWHQMLERYGITVAAVITVVFVVIWVLWGIAKPTIKDWKERFKSILPKLEHHDRQFNKLIVEMDVILNRFDEAFMRHVEDTRRLADEEHWKSCQVDKCPHLPKFFEELHDVSQLIVQFSEDAKTSRAGTKEAVNIIMRRIDEIALAFIAALRRNGGDK